MFFRARGMIPYGNCRDTTHSRCVIDEHKPLTPRNNNIMRELILNDDLCDDLGKECACPITQRPSHHVLEILVIRELRFDLSDCTRREIRLI